MKRWPPIVIAEGRVSPEKSFTRETNLSSKSKASGSVEAKQPSLEVAGEERSVINSAREQEIRRRAYELYLERGEEPGRDLEDWLQAERELASHEITSPE